MGKSLFIAEKPSVAQSFAEVMGEKLTRHDGYQEGPNVIVTWCVGHLVGMSYPEVYDEKLKRWSMETIPFLPKEYKYEVMPNTKKQFSIVSSLLNRDDVETIYVCTDAGREGEYIYRLVRQEAHVHDKDERRVWIDSQTEEEMRRGIKEAKPLSEYDLLSDAAYIRAKIDYSMGINFSRVLSLKYGRVLANFLNEKYCSIAVGRVMTCVQGMVVRREREIRDFVKTPFYRVLGSADLNGANINVEWKAVEGSKYFNSPLLYKENGFNQKSSAVDLISEVSGIPLDQLAFNEEDIAPVSNKAVVEKVEKKKEKKNPPLLYNLAEIQNDCSKFFKISPEQTLEHVQSLYEKKMVTYPRTDARVLSSAIAKEIDKNIRGLGNLNMMKPFVEEILSSGSYKGIEKTKYVNDKQITDHYAIIPTGQGLNALKTLTNIELMVYEIIVRRFLAIFYPAAEYEKVGLTLAAGSEKFFASEKYLKNEGYLALMNYTFSKKKDAQNKDANVKEEANTDAREVNTESGEEDGNEELENQNLREVIGSVKKGVEVDFKTLGIKEGETSPPKRYTSGSIILAMENAGNLIEDEELREQIKGSGIGTSATRAEIISKLERDRYIQLNKKTQVITPTLLGEMIFDVVNCSIRNLLSPKLTANWEMGLDYVTQGKVTSEEYMEKLEDYVTKHTNGVKGLYNQGQLNQYFHHAAQYYKSDAAKGKAPVPKASRAKKAKATEEK
ncbi:MAG: type IA DNA topoisomerase [Lachnospiraceae bacterium]|nr:type IA DNA topoisomerase [Lachnospiraceae bacterium]